MADNRMKLTKASIATLPGIPEGGKQVLIWDTEIRGFGLRIAPGGTKSYVMQRRVGRQTRRITIARADDMTPESARKKALILAGEFAQGVDPVAVRQEEARRGQTLRHAMEAYIAAPKKKGVGKGGEKKARTKRDVRVVMQRRFGDWLDKPLVEITESMVKERHASVTRASPAQANLAFRYLRAVINNVIADVDEGEPPILKVNPVTRLNRLNQWADVRPAKGRIPDARIPEWVDAVKTGLDDLPHGAEMRDALLFLLLTGARIGELFGSKPDNYPPLRWSSIDFRQSKVTFPDTKNRLDHEFPLPRELKILLENRKGRAGPEYVFSSISGELPSDLRPAFRRMASLTGIDVTAHDLRRTFSSVASKLDISIYKIKQLTNHISGNDVTADYVEVEIEELQEAIQKIEDHILRPIKKDDV
ncbi:integrase family protein [Paracoccus sp. MC1862]|uniref:tyrosine-type recombinase/integrase n=1 Tax=Paracoccus sp. MC1862 TaxID=2760307 RepID=UPI0016044A3B|nr:integrase family protein [Paracoccus sp. MC1862]MBB1497528.1 integrase family protein [Paracoccus sp. MC1862]QQO45999.1 integrase family protein [Paracoccus sp. MC1862]